MAIRWEKLTVKTQQAIQEAQSRAAELSNPELQPVHLLLALIGDREGVVPSVLEKIGVPIEHLESDLRGIEQKLPRVAGVASQPSLSQSMNKVLEQAFKEAQNFKDEYVSTEHLLLGVAHLKKRPRARRPGCSRRHARGYSAGAHRCARLAACDRPES